MAKTKNPTLTTPYSENMDKSCPWNEYPRPQLKRDSFFCLNGLWDFAVTKEATPPKKYTEKILVPFPPESALSGIQRRIGKDDRLYYRRKFTLPDGFKKDRIVLRFGAVDRFCRLTVNGQNAGIHNCGYLPFYADITDMLVDGENEILLSVTDNLSKRYPYGKQKRRRGGMWYTPVSGIWQTVWIESLPEKYIKNLRITPSMTGVKITVDSDAAHKVITLSESGERFEFDKKSIVITPKNIRLWSPEDPYLYHFTLTTETDRVESYFALREIGVKETDGISRLTLNGKPYLFNGLLDQGYYPDGIFLPASKDGYIEDIKLAKSMGFNTLRKHIKVEPAIFYHLCDTMGICVFQDMVNNGKYSFLRDTVLPTLGFKQFSDKRLHRSKKSRAAFVECMLGTTNTLYNYPSVLYYTIFNEGWGQFDANTMYRTLKENDSTRIVDATSGWFWQSESDIDSYHTYFKRLSVNSNTPRPIAVSEFGGYSHRVSGHLYGNKNYGYKNFEIRSDYEEALFNLYLNEVGELAKSGVSVFIYTQISDVEDETNGLITYDRKAVKIDAKKMRRVCDEIYSLFISGINDTRGENQ